MAAFVVALAAQACAGLRAPPAPPQAGESAALCARYLSEGRLEQAEARARLALELAPEHAEAWNCRGLVEYRRGHLELAVEDFERALSSREEFPEALNNLGALLMTERGELASAEDLFRSALELDPTYLAARVNLGQALLHAGRDAEAREQYVTCLELEPTSCDCRLGLGVLALGQGDWGGAARELEEHTRQCPDRAQGFYDLGWAQLQQGRCDEAYASFVSTLALEPDHHEARANLSVAVGCLARQDRGVEQLEAQAERSPDDAQLQLRLATLWEDRHEWGRAREALARAVMLEPTLALAHYRLARLADREEQPEEVIARCQRLVDLQRGEALAAERSWCVARVRELVLGPPPEAGDAGEVRP